jgi:hypothetical protein
VEHLAADPRRPALGRAGLVEGAVIRRGTAPGVLGALLTKMLRTLRPKPNELAIVDPYSLQTTPDDTQDPVNYVDLIDVIWAGTIDSAASLTIVTSAKFEAALLVGVEKKAKARNAAIAFCHQISSDYHDRFWIVDRTKDLFVGTCVGKLARE